MTTYFNSDIAKRYGVEEAVLLDRLRIYSKAERDSGLYSGLLLEKDGLLFVRLAHEKEAQDFPFWDWGHILGVVWSLVKAKALAVASHDGTLYCSLLIDAE